MNKSLTGSINALSQKICQYLNLPLPQTPLHPMFGFQVFNLIMSKLDENWEEVRYNKKNDESHEWRELIRKMEETVIDDKILYANEEITEVQILNSYKVMVSLCGNIRQATHSNRIHHQTKNLTDQIVQTVVNVMQKTSKNKNPKTTALMRDKGGNEAVAKAKRTFDYKIKEMEEDSKRRKGKNEKKKTKGNDIAYEKMMLMKQKKLRQEMDNHELNYYLRLREKKIGLVRNIHKLVEKLEREREIELHKEERETQKSLKEEQNRRLENIDMIFENNLRLLKEQHNKEMEDEMIKFRNGQEYWRGIEKEIKANSEKEIQKFKDQWKFEIEKLDKIEEDEERIKRKLIKIYRQNRV